MKISRVGIFGNGQVGSALARGALRAGYTVRSTGNDEAMVRQTAAWADLLILAVPFSAISAVVTHAEEGIAGKPLVDVTNRGTAHRAPSGTSGASGAEELQKRLPNARVVKAFNTVFAEHMDTGRVPSASLTTFVAGDDAEAKQGVLTLARKIGFDAVDTGALRIARYLESLAALNVHLGHVTKLGPNIAFKLLH